MSEPVTESPNFKYEAVRLETFQSWPANAKVEAWKMARAGLLYTGQEEEVKCLWCGVVLADWQFGDQVMARHRATSPDCPFVKNISDNIPCVPGTVENSEVTVRIPEDTDDVRPEPELVSPRLLSSVRPQLGSFELDGPDEEAGLHSGPVETDYRSEAARLASFSNWSVPFIQPADLARAGFYSLNNLDSCRCAFCNNCVGDWVMGDDPMTEHRHHFPLCPFVLGQDVGNIPLGAVAGHQEPAPGQDVTGLNPRQVPQPSTLNPRQVLPNSGPEKGHYGADSEAMGILPHSGPLHPQYATLEARLRTFREWPPALRQQPRDLAEAGFYYIGLSDQVKCFYCDGGLRNWQSEDEPWKEHARWFEKCVFVRLVKGDEYIKDCVTERPPEKAGLPVQGPRVVTEEDIRKAMSQAIVKQVLSMGIDHSRVKMAIKKNLENSGNPFDTPESLISAAFSVQRSQETRSQRENLQRVGAVLSTLGELRSNDVVTEQWEIGQDNMEIRDDDMEEIELEQPRNTSNDTISLNQPKSPLQPKPQPQPVPPDDLSVSSEAASSDLMTENTRLKEQRTCKICMDEEVGVVFLPCGHLCSCVNCAPSLKDCPVCRRPIQGTVRTFLS